MTKKRPFFERIVSMLLVAVMAFGMLPMSVFAEGSGGSGSETVPGNKYDGTFVYSAAYGSFTRFTLVEINIPDDDSTLHEPHSPDPGLNPNSKGEMFQDYGLVNRDTYKVIGSVNIGATGNSANKAGYPVSHWFDTNAVEYRIRCEEAGDSIEGRINAVSDYVKSSEKSSVPYYSWDAWVKMYGPSDKNLWDLSGYSLDSYSTEGGGDVIRDLLTVFAEMDYGGDNVTYGSFSSFAYSLLNYFGYYDPVTDSAATTPGTPPNDTLYWNNLSQRWFPKVFDFGDQKTYRIIVEDGILGKNRTTGEYWAFTARDLAAYSFVNDSVRKGLGYTAVTNAMTGMTDNYNQPYGFYAQPMEGTNTGYGLTTVENIDSAMWRTWDTSKIVNNNKIKYCNALYLMFGIDAPGGNNLVQGTIWKDKNQKNVYPAYGMAVLMPLKFDILTKGLTITKTVTNNGDEYKNMEWQFKIELDLNGAQDTGDYTVTDGNGIETPFDSFEALTEFLREPITLKSGQKFMIEGLPENATYTVTELVDGAESGGGSDSDGSDAEETRVGDDTGSEEEETWKTFVTDSGAENTSEVEATETTGTIPETGRANVTFKNTLTGGPAHLLVDVNLPGATATYDDQTGTIMSENIVECGTWKVNDLVTPITAAFNGQLLEPNKTTITIGQTTSGEDITAKFMGMYTAPTGGTPLHYLGNSQYEYRLEHEDLTVVYLQWQVGALGKDDPDPIPPGGSGELYTVFFDANYDGGPSFSSLTAKGGKYKYKGSLTVGPYSGTYTFELPIKWSYPDPPVREGWDFVGWAKEPTATSGTFTPEDPGGPDTYFGVWSAKETNWHANGGIFESENTDWMVYSEQVYPRGEWIPVLEEQPKREGYTFNGWFLDPDCTQPLEGYEEGIQPGRDYYAGWKAEKVVVTYYDTRDGTSVVHTQDYLYDDELFIFGPMEDTVGWTFTDWDTSHGGGGMTGKEANGKYLNTTDFNGLLQYHPSENIDDDPDSTMSAEGYWTLDFFAQWKEKTGTYNVEVVWNDYQNNDGARPTQIELGLIDTYNNNNMVSRITMTADEYGAKADTWATQIDLEHITDNDSSLQKRTYKIVFLNYTDIRGEVHQIQAPEIDGQQGTMELAAPSLADASRGVNTLYSYGVNNYYAPGQTDTGEYDTLITFNHSLITTGDDIQFTIDWDDDNDNDGVRPKSVMLVLYANGVPVSEFPMHNAYTGEVQVSAALCDVANDGDTWTYTFKDYQRYNDGEAIDYTVAIKNPDKTTTFNLNGYTTTYIDTNGDSEIGDHNGCTVSRPIELHEVPFSIVWDDENNRDGQRPEFVSVSLMSYQWNDHTYQWEYVEMATQTVRADDVNTMTAGEWTGVFELDADSLKYPVYHDGLEAIYHLVVTSDLNAFIPEGSFEYGWVESAYGNQKKVTPQVIISQNTNTVSVTANVYWNDSQNNDDIRPENIILQLYSHAPGEEPVAVPGAAYRVTISGDEKADNWYYTFSGMPKYAEGQSGVELIYTIQVFEVDGEPLYGYYIVNSNGEEEEVLRYEASYLTEATENDDNVVGGGSGTAGNEGTVETKDFTESDRAYVKLTHIAETQTMNFSVNWHDDDNRDNVRPEHVMVDLYKTVGDGTPVYVKTLDITENNGTWTYRVTGLAGYEDGQPVRYSIEVPDDVQQQLASLGYTVTTQDNIVHLYYTPGTGSITTQIYWSDDDNNDGYRPDSVIAELYANGVATGKTVDLNATNNWTWTWNDLPVHYVDGVAAGTDIIYSVQVQTPEHYTVTYNPTSTTVELNQTLYVQLYHGGDVQPVPVTVYWNDFRLSRRVWPS